MQKTRNSRKYQLKRRAETQAETRQRIVEAIVALHEEVGPAMTTISAVAERAGVERLTVYRHFPDERSQFVACSVHWSADHPVPDLDQWAKIPQPQQRLRTALRELYEFYRRGEPMLCNILRDAPRLQALQSVIEPFTQHMSAAVGTLADAWPDDGRSRPMLAAAIGHAVHFDTWRSLAVIQGLAVDDAVELMTGLVLLTAGDPPEPPAPGVQAEPGWRSRDSEDPDIVVL
jgi:AcrR family transcriptional regulator